jgi:MATE family multidrug resistance protein
MTPRRLRDRWTGPGGAPSEAGSRRELLALAWPLIVSNSFFTLQIALDRALLARHASETVGAAMPAVLLYWTPFALLQFTANYASVFVSQYVGAGRPHRVGPAVGQALYFSVVAGLVFLAVVAPLAGPVVALAGHTPALQADESTYLRCLAFAALPMLLTAAASSFFTGRGDSRTVLVINAAGFVVNGLLCVALIGGQWGFPAWGIAGAGWATVAGSWAAAVVALVLMLRPGYRAEFATHHLWRFEPALFRRLLRFGIPNGIMVALDGLVFLLFTILVGWLGPVELAATSMTFTLNAVAFLPAMGVAQAVEVLVGQRLGEDRPDLAERTTFTGLWLVCGFMLVAGAVFVTLPALLLWPFANPADPDWPAVAAGVAVLLRFVAVYSVFDSVNLVVSFALRGAGDTRFVAAAAFALAWPTMVLPTWAVTHFGGGVTAAWAFATVYICLLAGVFSWRFAQGKWKAMRVIEAVPAVEPEPEEAVA